MSQSHLMCFTFARGSVQLCRAVVKIPDGISYSLSQLEEKLASMVSFATYGIANEFESLATDFQALEQPEAPQFEVTESEPGTIVIKRIKSDLDKVNWVSQGTDVIANKLTAIVDQMVNYDQMLNVQERPPTGEDYSALFQFASKAISEAKELVAHQQLFINATELVRKFDDWKSVNESHYTGIKTAIQPDSKLSLVDEVKAFLQKYDANPWQLHASHLTPLRQSLLILP
jgi:hypothetical protein